ncbi:MAG TPA: PrsW family intramembrane metalloprotease [Pyrinomonadaceae bacterium]|jgi:RsiW-degrading membrane proteinase PrsW (M82 family)|nr:PrsW family intramembrane metalloprotease [Pyrinomonadaceae bacterium]
MDNFTAPSYQSVPPGAPRAAGGRGVLRMAVAAVLIFAAMLAGLFTLWLIGYETGLVPFLAGLIAATIPVPVYVTLVLWLDRYEPEPPWMLAMAFFWGALVAVFFAIIINSLGVLVVRSLSGEGAARLFGMVFSAPVVEESAKALVLVVLFFWRRDEFDGVTDGIVYAAMVGLGFAMTENVKYYGEAVLEHNAVGVFIVRGLFSPFAHPLFTGMTGVGLGLAAQSDRKSVKFAAPVVGFVAAMLFHAGWNASAFLTGMFENGAIVLLTYFLVMMPTFFVMLVVIVFSLRREGRILREHLRADVSTGLLSESEYQRLCSVTGRMAASCSALAGGGFGHWRARAQLNRAASELAFHRSRAARGISPRGTTNAEREQSYVRQIYDLRLRLEGK